MKNCKPELEAALGRTLSDKEYKTIEAELVRAKKEVAKDLGKDYGTLTKEEKAKKINDKLNQNRATVLSDLQNELLSQTKVLNEVSNATLGKDLLDISADELAANIRNMIGNTAGGRADFIARGGDRINFDSVKSSLVQGRLGDAAVKLLDGPLGGLVGAGKFFLNRDHQIKLADEIVNGTLVKDLIDDLNKELKIAGIEAELQGLDITLNRDTIVDIHNNNNKSTNQAAAYFESMVQPLLKDSNTVDLKELYTTVYSKKNSMTDGSFTDLGTQDILQKLPFKDGKSYMSFLEMFGSNKDLPTHIANTIDRVAGEIAKAKVFKGEDILAILDKKIESLKDTQSTNQLIGARNAYVEVVEGSGRKWDTTNWDLAGGVLSNTTSALFLGKAAVKGFATDKIYANAVLGTELQGADVVTYNKSFFRVLDNLFTGILKSRDQDADVFYKAIDAKMGALGHYLNTVDQSVLSSSKLTRWLQQTKRFMQNLAGKVQALQGQNANMAANKVSLSVIAQNRIFNPTYNPKLLGQSLSPEAHAHLQKTGVKSYTELKNLTRDQYNSKTGKNLGEEEFVQVKDKLQTEVESSIIYQIHDIQIDSGGVSVQAVKANYLGTTASGNYWQRIIDPLFGQFMSWSINNTLKGRLLNRIYDAEGWSGKFKHMAILAITAALMGYSNYSVGVAIDKGEKNVAEQLVGEYKSEKVDDKVYAEPYTDLVNMFDGDPKVRKEAISRFLSAILSGSGLFGVGTATNLFLGEGLPSPAIGLASNVLNEPIRYVTTEQTGVETLNNMINVLMGNLPLMGALKKAKDEYLKEKDMIDED